MNIFIGKINYSILGKSVFTDFSLNLQSGYVKLIKGMSYDARRALIGIIKGNINPDTGIVSVPNKISVSVLSNSEEFDNEMIVRHYLSAALRNKRMSCPEKVLNDLNVTALLKKRIKELTLEEKRSIGICKLVLSNSDVVVLDEPFVGLDYEQAKKLAGYVCKNMSESAILFMVSSNTDYKAVVDVVNFTD